TVKRNAAGRAAELVVIRNAQRPAGDAGAAGVGVGGREREFSGSALDQSARAGDEAVELRRRIVRAGGEIRGEADGAVAGASAGEGTNRFRVSHQQHGLVVSGRRGVGSRGGDGDGGSIGNRQ